MNSATLRAMKTGGSASSLDRLLARVCVNCPVCRTARRRQAGAAFTLVRKVETGVCPFCRAYERVFGRKAHEANPPGP
jgi:rubrerythrin